MAFYSRGYKKDEEAGANSLERLDKTTVMQEARAFNETPVNVRKCTVILTKIISLVNQGEVLSAKEATQLFFSVTQLFQSSNEGLRRLVYVCIKELCKQAEDVIIVTSSLTKDMTGRDDAFRAAAIRALCTIAESEPSIIQSIERYMKQAIVDRSPAVASAALVSSLHLLLSGNHDIVRRWANEVQEAVNSDSPMVQYHALGLLYHIRRNDKLAVSKLVTRFTSGRNQYLKSPLAMCLLIRIVCRVVQDKSFAEMESNMLDFLESCLRHKNEMVVYEAAYALVSLRQFGVGTNADMSSAISVLQLFCSSPKPTMRYTAVRTLSQIANSQPNAVASCSVDLEQLITDENRNIATLAITTLLKVGSEASVERLMKQITSFMSEISDEFKIVVVDAVKQLCMKYPRKHAVMMSYLAGMLRDEGGYEYKRAIVDTLVRVIEENPDAKEYGLEQLCEFIEDCEHLSLAVKILSLIGREGPKSSSAVKFIRYIYNRVILEVAQVRAAAVTALAKFGASREDVLARILVLLERCMLDEDDEVRDRATFYHKILMSGNLSLINTYILQGWNLSLPALEKELQQFVLKPQESAFDLSAVPIAVIDDSKAHTRKERPTPAAAEQAALERIEHAEAKRSARESGEGDLIEVSANALTEKMRSVPQLAELGSPFKSSLNAVQLTEAETEYVVKCIKHVFARHVVFQFDCTNTLNDEVLENVSVNMTPADEETAEQLRLKGRIPASKLLYSEPDSCFTVFDIINLDDTGDIAAAVGSFNCVLKYKVKDCDPNTGEVDENEEGYEDEYALEGVELSLSDYMQKIAIQSFESVWQELGTEKEAESTFVLPLASIEEAVKKIMGYLGMQACERTDRVEKEKSSHTLFLSGIYCGNYRVLGVAKFVMGGSNVVNMKAMFRSDNPLLSAILINELE